MTRYFQAHGSNASDAAGAGDRLGRPDPAAAGRPARLYRRVLDAGVLGLLMVPVALSLKSIDLGAPARGH